MICKVLIPLFMLVILLWFLVHLQSKESITESFETSGASIEPMKLKPNTPYAIKAWISDTESRWLFATSNTLVLYPTTNKKHNWHIMKRPGSFILGSRYGYLGTTNDINVVATPLQYSEKLIPLQTWADPRRARRVFLKSSRTNLFLSAVKHKTKDLYKVTFSKNHNPIQFEFFKAD